MPTRLLLPFALCLALGLTPVPVLADAASEAEAASVALMDAVIAMQEAKDAKDRVATLTQTIKAYEKGLAALRAALRTAELRQEALARNLATKRVEIGQLVGAMSALDTQPGPLLLLHPGGPLGTARSAMVLSDVTPALLAEANALKAELTELATLQALQASAAQTLEVGMAEAQAARTELSQAISDRTDLPVRLVDDPAALEQLLASAQTMDSFAKGLAADEAAPSGFADQKGKLPLPVLGRIVLQPGEPDASGARKPGVTLATRDLAMVTAPWASTVRYVGPLLDYGNVMILEPGDGYLVVLAGMDTVYVETGQVVGANAPLGLMGGTGDGAADLAAVQGTGAEASQTLYLEVRKGSRPVDPTEWFGPIE